MRIHVYNDTEVMDRVSRRFESLRRHAGRRTSTAAPATLGDPLVRGRASEVYFQAVTRTASRSRCGAGARLAARHQGPQVDDPGVGGLHLRPEPGRVQERACRPRAAPTRRSTSSTPAGLTGRLRLYAAEFGGAIDDHATSARRCSTTSQAAEGSESLAADTGGFIGQEHERPRRRASAGSPTRRAVYYLIGYNPTQHEAGRPLPQDRGEGSRRKGLNVHARKGYYAPLDGQDRAKPRKPGEQRPGHPGRRSTRRSSSTDVPMRMTAYAFDETLLGKLNAWSRPTWTSAASPSRRSEGRFVGCARVPDGRRASRDAASSSSTTRRSR